MTPASPTPAASPAAPEPASIAQVLRRFETVYCAVDGSAHSDRAAQIAIEIAGAARGKVVAAHAYAAQLHDTRFRQMEGGLPAQFRKEDELRRQRGVHQTLITRGLELISESYLDAVSRAADQARATIERRTVQGRNWRALLEDLARTRPDLAVLGAVGLGAAGDARLGSVCERVVRRVAVDALVVRDLARAPFARIGVAIDGSAESLGALISALELARAFGGQVSLVSSFDPGFHHTVFRAISGVLSEEAGKVFKLEAQRQLHEEIIDQGLARIYQGHLELAARAAAELGFPDLPTALVTGKAWVCLARFAAEHDITTLFLGRTGVHSSGDLDLGSCPEQLLRGPSPCNLFLSARGQSPERWVRHAPPLSWTEEALARLGRVPEFARPMAAGAVERRAREAGHTVVTSDLIDDVSAAMHGHGAPHQAERTPAAPAAPAEAPACTWEPEAQARLERIPPQVRPQVIAALERAARSRGLTRISAQAIGELKQSMAQAGAGCPMGHGAGPAPADLATPKPREQP